MKCGKGMIIIITDDIGRKYRADYKSNQFLTKLPPKLDYNRVDNKNLRSSLIKTLRSHNVTPEAVSDVQGVETAVVRNDKSSYLVLINHRDETLETNIKFKGKRLPQKTHDIFTLREENITHNNLKVKISPRDVMILPLN